jgi:DNA-binding HxlR family transcriptional regulator
MRRSTESTPIIHRERQAKRNRRHSKSRSLISDHLRILVCIAKDPDGLSVSHIAREVGSLAPETVERKIRDLVREGILTKIKTPTHNRYKINPHAPLHEPLLPGMQVGDLLGPLVAGPPWMMYMEAYGL